MRTVSLLLTGLVLTMCMSTGCSRLQSGQTSPNSLRIRAFIDGLDTIKIKGNEIWYEHHKWDLPGKWQGRFDEPTFINGKAWKPEWNGSISSPYRELDAAFPKVRAHQEFKLTKLEGRGSVTIAESPAPGNDYTLSILLDDADAKQFGGAAWYEILVEW